MDRIDAIKAYKVRAEQQEAEKEYVEMKKREDLALKIRSFDDRITKLIETANACLENGIEINAERNMGYIRSYDTWERGTFCTNSVTHRIGFVWTVRNNRFIGRIEEMGIDGGGANGEHYLRTDGKVVKDELIKPPQTYQMQRFVDTFDDFEKAFYDYIDKIVGR